MRFAGSRMEGFLSSDRPDYGTMAQKGLAIRNKEETTATDLMGQTAATGISEAGKVEAANITGAAEAALANAKGQAAIMGGIGDIAGSFIGAGIDAGAFGGTPSVKTSSTDYSSAFSTPTYSFGGLGSGFSW